MTLRGSTNVIVTLIGSPSLSRYFVICPSAYFAFYYQRSGLSAFPLKCLSFDDISHVKGEPIVHQWPARVWMIQTIQTRVSESLRSMFLLFLYHIWTSLLLLIEKRVTDSTNSSRQVPSHVVGNVAHLWVTLLPVLSLYDVPSWIYRLTSTVTHGPSLTMKHGCFFKSDFSTDCQFSSPVLTDVFILGWFWTATYCERRFITM